MYFDDVSRHAIQWKPSPNLPIGQPRRLQQPQQQPDESFPSLDDRKADAIRRMLLGYDAASASELSQDDVFEQVELWSSKSGVVGDFFGDELYQEVVGMSLCNATDVVGALAQFWTTITSVIRNHTDHEYSPLRWTTKSDAVRPSDQKNDVPTGDKVHFAVFPNCQDLYDYKTMFTFLAAVEFSKETCLHLGKRFSLSLFHPKFRNGPKMLSPERHSPFPIAGLQFHQPGRRLFTEPGLSPSDAVPKRQRGNGHFTTVFVDKYEEEDEDANLTAIVEGRLFDISDQRDRLEVLFNSAAVAGSDEDVLGSIGDYDTPDIGASTSSSGEVLSEEDILTLNFRKEQQTRRRNLPKARVKSISKAWINKHRFADPRRTQENVALRFIDSLPDDGWFVSDHKAAEFVYADIWQVISGLYQAGLKKEEIRARKLSEKEEDVPETFLENNDAPHRKGRGVSSHFDFLKSFGRPFQINGGEDAKKKISRPQSKDTISSMFVATKFCAYNAQQFKRFAITINAALKRLTGGRMFLEVFHNEYTGRSGFDSALRRSPFPMIQIVYEMPTDDRSK